MEQIKIKSEDNIQAEFFQRAWNEMPETRNLLFAVPNGGKRDIREAQKLKATGVLAGIPDMIFIWDGRAYGFELKVPGGQVSNHQHKIHKVWAENKTLVWVIFSAQQGLDKIKEIIY